MDWPSTAPASTSAPASLTSVDALLEVARMQLGMDVAFISEFVGDQRVMRHITASVPTRAVPGDAEPLEGTYCQRIVDGRLPNVIPATAANPVAAAIPATTAASIAAYVGVPVVFRDGRVFGTLCCISRTPEPDLTGRDASVLSVVAKAVSELLEEGQRERDVRDVMIARVERIVDDGGPAIVYQPIVDVRSRRWAGLEALSRFPSPSDLTTESWYAGAAAVGAETALELSAARSAVGVLDHLPEFGGYLSINLSARTICTPAGQRFMAGLPLHRVVIELTEHVQIPDYDSVMAVLAPLRAAGLRLAVDDAGAGFASLRHILRLSADIIKLDRSLISGVESDPARRALVSALSRFAADTGSVVVAEGVETPAELEVVEVLGVTHAQGYLLGRPSPLADLRLAASA